MEKTRRYGSGRVLYWAHVAGPTERRGSVRFADTAFELMPLATPRNPYDNVLLVDMATHPRLIPADVLQNMLDPGIYLTDVARGSMPGLDEGSLKRTISHGGEIVWTVTDTTVAFASYWTDEEKLDTSTTALEQQHRRIRALSEGRGHLTINAFPVPYTTVVTLRGCRIFTLNDLMDLDLTGVTMLSDLVPADLAEAYRIIRGTLEVRMLEDAPDRGIMEAAE